MINLIRYILCLFFMIVSFSVAQISRGIVKEDLKVESKILKKEMSYSIYLPFDYETSQRFYPVVYLLHGFTDDDSGWIQFGEAHLIADEAIAKREIPPMVIVMPDAGLSWYMNNYDGSIRYEDFFITEFIPEIESKYRIRQNRRFRGLCGLSMGGFGSLLYALKYPDLFSVSAPLSAAIFTDDQIIKKQKVVWERLFENVFPINLQGKQRLTEHLMENNVFHIIENNDIEKVKQVRFYIDCGDDDIIYSPANAELHIALSEKEIPHEYRVRDGGHKWSYWRNGLKPYFA